MIWAVMALFLLLIVTDTAQATEFLSADLRVDRTYDNNLFRLADNLDSQTVIGTNQTDDVINNYGIQLNLDLPLSLQNLTGHAAVVASRFEHNNQLDNNSLDLMLGWDGEIAGVWGGSVKWQRKRILADFSNFQGSQRSILTHNHGEIRLDREIGRQWLVWGDWKRDSYSRSLISQQQHDRRSVSLRLGVTGRSSAGSELMIFASSRSVDLVNLRWFPGALQDDALREDGLRFNLKWKMAANMTVDSGIGVERVVNPHLSQNDYSGISYDLALAWNDDGRLNWQSEIWRNIDTVDSVYSNYVARKGGRLNVQWSVRETLMMKTKMSIEWLDYEGGNALQREDEIQDLSLSLVYKPLRNTDLSLTYTESKRDSTIAFGGFRDHQVQLSASIHWQ